MQKITEENQRLLKRIQEVPPAYNHLQWEEEAKRNDIIKKCTVVHSHTCSLTHSLSHLFTHSFIRSLTHSFVYSRIHFFSHSLTHGLTN